MYWLPISFIFAENIPILVSSLEYLPVLVYPAKSVCKYPFYFLR